jgi:uncharacterized protein YbjT (DUF2867 family)
MTANLTQGLNYHWLNFVSARNVANMCVGDGVQHMVLMSTARAPWINGHYLHAKREAENYMSRVGLNATIIRAPVAYVRGVRRHPFYILMTILGNTPIVSWFGFGRMAPMPADMLARGVARITLDKKRTKTIYYAHDLRKRNTAREARRAVPLIDSENLPRQKHVHPFELLDEDTPFGWIPRDRGDKDE